MTFSVRADVSTVSSAFCGHTRVVSMPTPAVSSTMFQALYAVTPALIQSRMRPQLSTAYAWSLGAVVALNGVAHG